MVVSYGYSMGIINRPFRYTYSNTVLVLIGINIVVFIGQNALRSVNLTGLLAMTPAAVVFGYIWQLVTYMFVHFDVRHILFNMLGLFLFGTHVEQRMGSREFLLFYLLTGTLAGIFS
jgi:membrane associated rhomboid family serine protease